MCSSLVERAISFHVLSTSVCLFSATVLCLHYHASLSMLAQAHLSVSGSDSDSCLWYVPLHIICLQGAIHATKAVIRIRNTLAGHESGDHAHAHAEGSQEGAAASGGSAAASNEEDIDPERLRRMMEGTAL